MSLPTTWCYVCRGEDQPAQHDSKGSPRFVTSVEHRPVNNPEAPVEQVKLVNCLRAQPGLGRYGFIIMYRLDRRGMKFVCTGCGKEAASYRSIGDTRVEHL